MASQEDIDVCMPSYNYFFQKDILKNKVAFITGGGSGIGFTITEVLMRHGCKTVIASRNIDKIRKSARKLEAATGQECLAVQMDVRKPEAVLAAVDKALSHYGKIDILINSAAGNFLCPASSMSFNAFKTVIEIDTIGTFNVSKAVFDRYLKDHGGVIINISATLPYKGTLFQLHASAAKAAIDSMTKTLCNEWGQFGIRVVGIAPGPIADTEGMRKLAGPALAETAAKHIPLGRLGTKKEIGEMALFLASPVASFVSAGPMSKQVATVIPLGRAGSKREVGDLTLYMASDAASFITGTTVVIDGGHWMTTPNSFELMKTTLNSLL